MLVGYLDCILGVMFEVLQALNSLVTVKLNLILIRNKQII